MDLFADGEPRGFADLSDKPPVKLDGSKPALKPCRWCGSQWGYHTGPTGPHHDGIRCNDCERHLGWLPSPNSAASVIDDD